MLGFTLGLDRVRPGYAVDECAVHCSCEYPATGPVEEHQRQPLDENGDLATQAFTPLVTCLLDRKPLFGAVFFVSAIPATLPPRTVITGDSVLQSKDRR